MKTLTKYDTILMWFFLVHKNGFLRGKVIFESRTEALCDDQMGLRRRLENRLQKLNFVMLSTVFIYFTTTRLYFSGVLEWRRQRGLVFRALDL